MQFTSTFFLTAAMATSVFSLAVVPRQEVNSCLNVKTVTVTIQGEATGAASLPVSGVVGAVPTGNVSLPTGGATPSAAMPMSVPVPSVTVNKNPAPALPTDVQLKDSKMIINVIDDVKKQSGDLNDIISPLSLSLLGATQAPAIAAQVPPKLSQLAKTAADGVSALTDIKGSIEGASSENIVTALVDFVQVHQNLLKTISGKHGIIAKFGFAEPVRVALVNLEGVVDAFAFALINVIPTKMDKGTMAKGMLDSSLTATIKVYSS